MSAFCVCMAEADTWTWTFGAFSGTVRACGRLHAERALRDHLVSTYTTRRHGYTVAEIDIALAGHGPHPVTLRLWLKGIGC